VIPPKWGFSFNRIVDAGYSKLAVAGFWAKADQVDGSKNIKASLPKQCDFQKNARVPPIWGMIAARQLEHIHR
jgi:hypothetical protein